MMNELWPHVFSQLVRHLPEKEFQRCVARSAARSPARLWPTRITIVIHDVLSPCPAKVRLVAAEKLIGP